MTNLLQIAAKQPKYQQSSEYLKQATTFGKWKNDNFCPQDVLLCLGGFLIPSPGGYSDFWHCTETDISLISWCNCNGGWNLIWLSKLRNSFTTGWKQMALCSQHPWIICTSLSVWDILTSWFWSTKLEVLQFGRYCMHAYWRAKLQAKGRIVDSLPESRPFCTTVHRS